MRFLVPSPRADAAVRLVCFPHAGGTAAFYTAWARALESEPIEVVAAELAGRDAVSGEEPSVDLEHIVNSFVDAIGAVANQPYALFGHSLGALIAFEVARRLRDGSSSRPLHLFVSGAFAPQSSNPLTPLRSIAGDAQFLEAVASRYGGVPRIVLEQAELRASIVPALRADLELTETYAYRPEPPLACPITAYAGSADPIVSDEGLVQWRAQTTAEFSWQRFDGGHFYLNRARDALLADITGRLARLA